MTPSNRLSGKTVLVTGASSGIGRATARALADRGASVALAARRESELRDFTSAIEADFGADSLVVPTDITDPDAMADMVTSTGDEFGALDVTVSNAGVICNDDVAETSIDVDCDTDVRLFDEFLFLS